MLLRNAEALRIAAAASSPQAVQERRRNSISEAAITVGAAATGKALWEDQHRQIHLDRASSLVQHRKSVQVRLKAPAGPGTPAI